MSKIRRTLPLKKKGSQLALLLHYIMSFLEGGDEERDAPGLHGLPLTHPLPSHTLLGMHCLPSEAYAIVVLMLAIECKNV